MKTFDVNNIQLKIQSPGMVVNDKLEKDIIRHIEKLGKTYSRITKCEVVLRTEKSDKKENCIMEASLFVPGKTLFAKSQQATFSLASGKMFDDLRDQLLKVKEKFSDKSAVATDKL